VVTTVNMVQYRSFMYGYRPLMSTQTYYGNFCYNVRKQHGDCVKSEWWR